MSDSITIEGIIRVRELMDAVDVPIPLELDHLVDGEIGQLKGFAIKRSWIDERQHAPNRHDWWNQGNKY